MSQQFTHDDLVYKAYRWVLKNQSCGIAFREMSPAISKEKPDVMGFGSNDLSVLVEVKVTRSDFLSDKKKEFRKNPEKGMGMKRFYFCPKGVIKKEDLPEGWGLVHVNEKGKPRTVHNPYKRVIKENEDGLMRSEMQNIFRERNILAERDMMYSVLRRLHLIGRIDELYESPSSNKKRFL